MVRGGGGKEWVGWWRRPGERGEGEREGDGGGWSPW